MPNSNANLVRSWLLVVAAYMRLRLRGGAKLTPTEMALYRRAARPSSAASSRRWSDPADLD